MSGTLGPDSEDLVAQEIVRRASDEDPVGSASAPAVASLAVGVVGWIAVGVVLLLVLALAGCIAAYA